MVVQSVETPGLSWSSAQSMEPVSPRVPATAELGTRAWLVSALVHGLIAGVIAVHVRAPTHAAAAIEPLEIAITPIADPSPPPTPPPPAPSPVVEARVEATPVHVAPSQGSLARVASTPSRSPVAVSSVTGGSETPAIVAAGSAAPTFVMALPTGSRSGIAVPNAPTTRPASDEVVDEKGVSTRAQVAYGPLPVYPREARAAEIETDVPVEIVVDPTGSVVDARLERSVGYGIDEATLRAIKKYRFKPALKDGRAVAVRMQWTMQYRLE